jgi:hypothetical protein
LSDAVMLAKVLSDTQYGASTWSLWESESTLSLQAPDRYLLKPSSHKQLHLKKLMCMHFTDKDILH